MDKIHPEGAYNLALAVVQNAVSSPFFVGKGATVVNVREHHLRRAMFLKTNPMVPMTVDIMGYDWEKFLAASLEAEKKLYDSALLYLKVHIQNQSAKDLGQFKKAPDTPEISKLKKLISSYLGQETHWFKKMNAKEGDNSAEKNRYKTAHAKIIELKEKLKQSETNLIINLPNYGETNSLRGRSATKTS